MVETQKEKGSYVMMIQGPPDVNQYVKLSPTTGRNNGIFSLSINSPNLLDYEDSKKRNITFQVRWLPAFHQILELDTFANWMKCRL